METTYTAADYKSAGKVKWCPGCGDHAVLSCLHKAMAQVGIAPDQIAVVSGIGCSSRLPYYMNTYGFHTIHGRAAAVATGLKTANPDLCVWQISGDGDGLAIGGNHFIHAIRRNIDLNILLMNNHIYGLTKGQYSPTSPRGFVSKSSPYGTVEDPFRPAELAMGARSLFFARLLDVDLQHSQDTLVKAAQHKGTSVVEALVNCVIFTDGFNKEFADKEFRQDRTIYLEHGKKMLFGKDGNKGLMQDGFGLKVVTVGENGVTLDDILTHDAHCPDNTLHTKLALMQGPDFPVALGVIRDVEGPTYEEEVRRQVEDVKAKHPGTKSLGDFFKTLETWEIK